MPRTHHALYVKGDLSSAKILSLYLTKLGLRVSHCDNAKSAYRALDNLEFDLAILDVMLLGGDGREVLKYTVAKHIPSIMVTAKVDESDRLTGFELKADDYICKPPLRLKLIHCLTP